MIVCSSQSGHFMPSTYESIHFRIPFVSRWPSLCLDSRGPLLTCKFRMSFTFFSKQQPFRTEKPHTSNVSPRIVQSTCMPLVVKAIW